jgi:hypothetical protein
VAGVSAAGPGARAPGVRVLLPPARTASERDAVALALSPRGIAPSLDAALGADGRPRCRILDAKYEPARRCRVLYERGGGLVLGVLDLDGAAGAPPTTGAAAGWGARMTAYPFPHDPGLPTLAQALDGRVLAASVDGALAPPDGGGGRLIRCRVEPLRYRPGRRCTLRVETAYASPAGAVATCVRYAKLYHDADKAAAVHETMRRVAAAPALTAAGAVPARPVAFVPDLALMVLAPVPGVPLAALLGRAGAVGDARAEAGTVRAAEAVAALHAAALAAPRVRAVAPSLARMGRRAAAVSPVDGRLAAAMGALAGALAERLPAVEAEARITLLHGDCKPSQFLLAGETVGMLDFDHAGMGDAACDVGDFLGALRQTAVRDALVRRGGRPDGRARWLRSLEAGFLTRYARRRGGDGTLAERARWYQSAALLRKAFRAFQRSPRSPLAAALVAEGAAVLAAPAGATP